MSISEQVKELREMSQKYPVNIDIDLFERTLNQAADTIESLSAKLKTANEELKRWHTSRINENIKNPFAWTSTLICHNCDHKDDYIEELEAENMEQSAENCGGEWIPCKNEKNMPENDGEYWITCSSNYEPGVNRVKKINIVDGVMIGTNGLKIFAWMPLVVPEPYHEP